MRRLYSNQFCIGLISYCNWNCDYCVAKNNNFPINEEDILTQVQAMKDVLGSVYLSGGEPGLLSADFWEKMFNMTHHNLAICTNGTFLLRGHYSRWKDRIREVVVHCVEELDSPINPIVLDFIHKEEKIKPTIVVHCKNVQYLRGFLLAYQDINFQIFFADESFVAWHKEDKVYRHSMNHESAKQCIYAIRGLGYDDYTSRLMRAIIKDDFSNLNSWSHMNKDYTKP